MRLVVALVGIAMALAAPGCARETAAPGGGTAAAEAVVAPSGAARLDAHRTLADAIVVGNLTVWPVVTDAPVASVQVAAFEQAQKDGTVAVREMGGGTATVRVTIERAAENGHADPGQVAQAAEAAAEVNRLTVENKGDVPVLICAGTVLRGGNQDRQVGEDVVVAAHSTQDIEVYCVEQGRWTSRRQDMDCGVEFACAQVVATKAVRMSAQYEKSQGAVWSNVAESNQAVVARSATPAAEDVRGRLATLGYISADAAEPSGLGYIRCEDAAEPSGRTTFLAALEDVSNDTNASRDRVVETVRKHFDASAAGGAKVIGFAYAVDGKPVGVRTFANPGLLEAVLPSFARSMALESEAAAATAAESGAAKPAPAKAEDVVALVRAIESGDLESPLVRQAHALRIRKGEAGFNSSCSIRPSSAAGTPVTVTEDWLAR